MIIYSKKIGLIAGSIFTTYVTAKSTDGGNSWTEIADSFYYMYGDGYEKFFGWGQIQGGDWGIYESPDTSFNWNNVFTPVDGVNHISIGRDNSTNFGWLVGSQGTIARYNEQITNIKGVKTVIAGFTFSQNYPNPFNPKTTLKYEVPELRFVTLKVYDVLGNEIVTLVNEEKPVGNFEVEFDASALSSGIYFYRLQAGSFIETKKMALMK